MSDEYENYGNLWISENYCPNWGIWEVFREILQNQYDSVIKNIGDNKKVKVIAKTEYEYNGIEYLFEFDFINEEDGVVYGSIKYDRVHKRLIIQNKGKLEKADLLMGGRGEKYNTDNKQIIGRHGEGMKLAALALLRYFGKDFRIYTNGEEWHFKLIEDKGFPIDGNKNSKVLKMKVVKDSNPEHIGKVTVEISNIDLEKEWIQYIDRLLWLVKCQKDEKLNLCAIKAVDEKGEEFGEIFLGERYQNKIYVKGIYVQDLSKENKSVACVFGFNVDLELDRDRNAIKDLDKRNILFSKILANILRRRLNIIPDFTGTAKNMFDNYLKLIVDLIQKDYIMIRHITDKGNLRQQDIDDIWNVLEDEFDETDYGTPKKKQMLYSPYIGKLNDFLNTHKLPKEFYPYHTINCWLTWEVIKRSSYYKTHETLYKEKIRENKNIVKEPSELKDILDNIAKKLKNSHSSFKREYIKFKKFNFGFKNDSTSDNPMDKIVDFENNIIYFSESLKNSITNDKKNWIFKMIVEKYNIDLYELV